MGMHVSELPLTYKSQADAWKNQANPVQNTWYTALDTTAYVRIREIAIAVQTNNETLELQITIDGVTVSGSVAATAGTFYYPVFIGYTQNTLTITANTKQSTRAFFLEGKSVKVEIRKTTAAGAGNLQCLVAYDKLVRG